MSNDTNRLDWIEDLVEAGMAIKISQREDGRIEYNVDGDMYVKPSLRDCIDADVLDSARQMVSS